MYRVLLSHFSFFFIAASQFGCQKSGRAAAQETKQASLEVRGESSLPLFFFCLQGLCLVLRINVALSKNTIPRESPSNGTDTRMIV